MDFIDTLLRSSPADMDQMLVGAIAGGVVLLALAMTALLRKLVITALALVIVHQIVLHGLGGLVALAHGAIHAARTYEPMVKGLFLGKVFAGLWWHLRKGTTGHG